MIPICATREAVGPTGVLERIAASVFPRGSPTPASFTWWLKSSLENLNPFAKSKWPWSHPLPYGRSGPYLTRLWRVQGGEARAGFIPVLTHGQHWVWGSFKVAVQETPPPRNPLTPTLPDNGVQGIPSLPGVYNNNSNSCNFALLRSHPEQGIHSSLFTASWEVGSVIAPSWQMRKLRLKGKVMGPRSPSLHVRIYSQVCLTWKHNLKWRFWAQLNTELKKDKCTCRPKTSLSF